MTVVVGALTVLGWIIVIALVVVVVLSIVYFRGRRPTPEQIEAHELEEAELRKRPDPPGWSPH
jgi:hypothetical protein